MFPLKQENEYEMINIILELKKPSITEVYISSYLCAVYGTYYCNYLNVK